jgi:hypothetical protein
MLLFSTPIYVLSCSVHMKFIQTLDQKNTILFALTGGGFESSSGYRKSSYWYSSAQGR